MTAEDRLARLERDYARLDQRDINAGRELQALAAVPTTLVRMEGAIESMREQVKALKEDLDQVTAQILDRGKEQSEERRSLKIALIGLIGVISAALIGGIAVVLAGSGHL